MEYVHASAPDWVTVKVLPAAWIVPLRWLLLLLAPTEYETDPLPLPLDPPVTCNQDVEVLAVQLHPDCVVTLKLPELLLEPKLCEEGEIEYVHELGGFPKKSRP